MSGGKNEDYKNKIGSINPKTLKIYKPANPRNMNQKATYCCHAIEQETNDPRVFINYNPQYREYSISTTNKHIIRLISNCPWCSIALPTSVRNELFDILEKKYQLDDPWSIEQEKLVPAEFKTDEWWKKRGL